MPFVDTLTDKIDIAESVVLEIDESGFPFYPQASVAFKGIYANAQTNYLDNDGNIVLENIFTVRYILALDMLLRDKKDITIIFNNDVYNIVNAEIIRKDFIKMTTRLK